MTTLPLDSAAERRPSSWTARVRRGLHSERRIPALLIRALDLGPCTRPLVAWSPVLLALALLGSGLVFLDGVFTALALQDSTHPFVAEMWGPTAKIIEVAGIPGMLFAKLLQALFLFFALDLTRRRGLRKSVWLLALVIALVGALLVANSLLILLSPPTLLY